jgi:hypothetical protein
VSQHAVHTSHHGLICYSEKRAVKSLKKKPFLLGEPGAELLAVFMTCEEGVPDKLIRGDPVFDALGGMKWLQNRSHTPKVDEKTLHRCDFCAQASVKLYGCMVL